MFHRITTPPPAESEPKRGGGTLARVADRVWGALYYIYVLASLEIGIILLFLPWKHFWANNYILYLYPQVRPVVTNPYFKGFVLGLGIVNILIGIHEVTKIRHSWQSRHLSR